MIKKVLLVFGIYFTLIFFNNCERCGEFIPYFDFENVSFRFENGPTLSNNELLLFRLNPEDVSYMATHYYNGFGNSAYADCVGDGDFGLKYPIENIEFLIENDFNDTIKKGDTVTAYVQQQEYNSSLQQYEYFPVDTVTQWKYFNQTLRFNIVPDSNQTNQLKVILTKSNGKVVEGVSEDIVWE
jgi:hypothetical protein